MVVSWRNSLVTDSFDLWVEKVVEMFVSKPGEAPEYHCQYTVSLWTKLDCWMKNSINNMSVYLYIYTCIYIYIYVNKSTCSKNNTKVTLRSGNSFHCDTMQKLFPTQIHPFSIQRLQKCNCMIQFSFSILFDLICYIFFILV